MFNIDYLVEDEVDNVQYPIILDPLPTKVIQKFTIARCDLTDNSILVNLIVKLLPSVKVIEFRRMKLTASFFFRILQVKIERYV